MMSARMPVRSLSRTLRAFSAQCLTSLGTIGTRVLLLARMHERLVQRDLPESIHRVLFVCKGNVCRSPLASVYLAAKLEGIGVRISVQSAGLDTTPGKPAHHLARTTAQRHGLSLEKHATTLVTSALVDQADVIIVMEYQQQYQLVSRHPDAARKAFHLRSFYDSNWTDIEDPYSGDQGDFEACYQIITQACDKLLDSIKY
jgi:protein-tyrosine phosphatase